MLAALVSAGAVSVPGCGQREGCSEAGCENLLSFTIRGLDVPVTGLAVLRGGICFDDRCEERVWRFRGSSPFHEGDAHPVEIFRWEDSVEATMNLDDQALDGDTSHEVSIELSSSTGGRVEHEESTAFDRDQPNGPGCGPICWEKRLEVSADP